MQTMRLKGKLINICENRGDKRNRYGCGTQKYPTNRHEFWLHWYLVSGKDMVYLHDNACSLADKRFLAYRAKGICKFQPALRFFSHILVKTKA